MYEKTITLKKMGWQMLYGGLSAAVTAGINFIQALPLEQNTLVFIMMMAFFQGTQNYLKHHGD